MSAPASPVAPASPTASLERAAGDTDVRAGGVSVRAGLSVTGRPGRKGRAARGVPCERCQYETCGSLQLPCGRLVILCETCALEFYDVLIKKIVKFEATFEEFLLEQQEKEGGKESPTRVQSPARRPGNAGAASIASPTERGSQHGERAPQHGDRAPRQRPGTSSERRRPDTTSALASAGAARPRATPGEVPNSPSTPSRDDMIVTRGESKGGLSGFLDPRRRPGRQGPRPAGVMGVATSIGQAANSRLMNGRSQRPATSAYTGEGTLSREDRFALAHGKPRASSSSFHVNHKDPNGFDPGLAGSHIKSLSGDVPEPSAASPHASELIAGAARARGGYGSPQAHRGGYGSMQAPASAGVDGQGGRMGTPPGMSTPPPNLRRSNSMQAVADGTSTPPAPDQLRSGRQRVLSDSKSNSGNAQPSQHLFSNLGWGGGEIPPSVTKKLPNGSSPLRRGGGSWGRNAEGWSQLPQGNNPLVPDFVRSSPVTRTSMSAHGPRAVHAGVNSGRDLGASEKNPITRLLNSSSGMKDWGWGSVGNGTPGNVGMTLGGTTAGAATVGGTARDYAGYSGSAVGEMTPGRTGTPPRRNVGPSGVLRSGSKGPKVPLEPDTLSLGGTPAVSNLAFQGAEWSPRTISAGMPKQRQLGLGFGAGLATPGSGAASKVR